MNLNTAEQLVIVFATISSVASLLTQLIKGIAIDPSTMKEPQRSAVLRGVLYALNLLLLVGFVATQGQFSVQAIPLYVSVAFGQALASHANFKVLSQGMGGGVPPVPPTNDPVLPTQTEQPEPTVPLGGNL